MASKTKTSDRSKQIVEKFQREIINENWEKAKEYLHPDVKVHFPMTPVGGETPSGKDGVIGMFKLSAAWFRFVKADCLLWATGEDTLFEVVELHFEHTGEFFGVPPTHKRFAINGLGAWRFKDDLICDHWGQYDMVSIPAKLGLDLPAGALFPKLSDTADVADATVG